MSWFGSVGVWWECFWLEELQFIAFSSRGYYCSSCYSDGVGGGNDDGGGCGGDSVVVVGVGVEAYGCSVNESCTDR